MIARFGILWYYKENLILFKQINSKAQISLRKIQNLKQNKEGDKKYNYLKNVQKVTHINFEINIDK